MSFKPKQQPSSGDNTNRNIKYPDPASDGTQACRVSLIVDMGLQERENGEEVYNKEDERHQKLMEEGATLTIPTYGTNKGKSCISYPRKPKQGVAVFVDLVSETVDYGDLGQRHYRYMLNNKFKTDVIPITFAAVPPKVQGGVWTLDPKSVLSKLAHATEQLQIVSAGDDNMDISQLLGKPCLIDIELVRSEKNGKTYTNVKYKSVAKLMKGMTVPELVTEAKLITFDNATTDDVRFIRKDVRAKIQQALDFKGSQMEAAFREAGFLTDVANEGSHTPVKSSAPVAAQTSVDDFEDDIPFNVAP